MKGWVRCCPRHIPSPGFILFITTHLVPLSQPTISRPHKLHPNHTLSAVALVIAVLLFLLPQHLLASAHLSLPLFPSGVPGLLHSLRCPLPWRRKDGLPKCTRREAASPPFPRHFWAPFLSYVCPLLMVLPHQEPTSNHMPVATFLVMKYHRSGPDWGRWGIGTWNKNFKCS